MQVTNLSANYDAAVQAQQLDDGIAQKFDMIVLCYVNDQAVIPALTRAKAAGIPVILFADADEAKNRKISGPRYIGTENADLGRLAGEDLVQGLAAEGKTTAKVVAVTGSASRSMSRRAWTPSKPYWPSTPASKLVATEDGKWNTALSEKDHWPASGAL